MPTLNQVRTTVDNWLTAHWPLVLTRQEAYFQNHGRYWQGLVTHLTTPTHTTVADGSTTPDNLASKPTDQNSSWMDALPEWATEVMAASVRMDVYVGPDGHGYVGTVTVIHNTTTYTRSQNVGPESWRTQAWHSVAGES